MDAASLAQLDEAGFVVVRGLLGREEIEILGREFEGLEATARTLAGTGDVGDAHFVVRAEPFQLRRVVWCGGASPVLAALGDDPRFVGLAEAVLGTSPVVQLIQQAHFKLPGDRVAFAWHQDASNRRYGSELWTDVDGRGSFVEIAVAVDPMSPQNGGLRMLPGTHRLGFVADPHTGVIPTEHLGGRELAVQLEPGDAVVFGPFVIHGSGPNEGATPRRLFLQGYAAPGANHRVYPGCGLGVVRTPAGSRSPPV